MAVPNMAIHILLVTTIGMTFFSAVTALKCYNEDIGQKIDELECDFEKCATVQCGDGDVVRGCVDGPYDNIIWVRNDHFVNLNLKNDGSCQKSYCTDDWCNNKDLEKTGLICNRKDYYKNDFESNPEVQECVTGHVGCVVDWDCKDGKRFTFFGCSSQTDECKSKINGGCCKFCDTDLCNLKPKIAEKSTTPENEVKFTTPESDEKSTPKNEENPDPLNGSASIVGFCQIGIIPIGMMILVVLGLKMLII